MKLYIADNNSMIREAVIPVLRCLTLPDLRIKRNSLKILIIMCENESNHITLRDVGFKWIVACLSSTNIEIQKLAVSCIHVLTKNGILLLI